MERVERVVYTIGGTHIVRPTMGAPRSSEICGKHIRLLSIRLICVPYLGENFWVVVVRDLRFRSQQVSYVEIRRAYSLDDSSRSLGRVARLG